MAGLLSERKPFLLLLVLLALNLVLMSGSVRSARGGSVLEEGILTLASPLLKAASITTRWISDVWSGYVDLRGIREQNADLRRRMDRLALRAQELEEMRHEVARLRQMLDLRERVRRPSVAAHVIAQGTAGGSRNLLLDRGARSGIRIGQPVIAPRGLVGRVIESAPTISKVQTILDPSSGVAALIQRTRVQGLVVGEGDRGCRMEYVIELSDVEVGDVVVASGLDRIYPKGHLIGVVASLGEGERLTRYVGVRPEVDFRRLEEVLVLLDAEGPSVEPGP